MPGRRKLTDEERIQAVQEYFDGKGSYRVISKKYGISAANQMGGFAIEPCPMLDNQG